MGQGSGVTRTWVIGRWLELRRLEHQLKVARLQADIGLAAYYAKSRIEWDMKWAGDALGHTWKDEYLLILWSVPTIGLFIPGLRDIIQPGFEALKLISDNAPSIFFYGWTSIFAATFAVRGWSRYTYPNRLGGLMSSMQGIPDDVPLDAAAKAQSSIDASASDLTGGGFRVN